MTSGASFALSGFTLHSWLSLAELLIFSSVIYGMATTVWRKSHSARRSTPSNSIPMRDRYETLGLRLVLARLRSKFNTGRTRTKGHADPTSAWLLLILVFPLGLLCWGYYSSQSKHLPQGSWSVGKTETHPITEDRDLVVMHVWSPYRYTWQHVQDGKLIGLPFTHDICEDFESPSSDFIQGIILTRMIYVDEGSCWSLNPDKHAGFYKLRDDGSKPIYMTGVRYGG
jgi:hypothetical protein